MDLLGLGAVGKEGAQEMQADYNGLRSVLQLSDDDSTSITKLEDQPAAKRLEDLPTVGSHQGDGICSRKERADPFQQEPTAVGERNQPYTARGNSQV